MDKTTDINSTFWGRRFLIADQFPYMCRLLRGVLQSLGAKDIDIASNGKEAIAFLEKHHYHAILCNYDLGNGMNGQDVIEEARKRELVGLATAWIIITSEKTRDKVLGFAENMVDEYIIKPFSEDMVKGRLMKAISKRTSFHDIEQAIHIKDFTLAISLCDKALDSHPAHTYPLLRIKAGLQLKIGHLDRARQIFNQVLMAHNTPWAKAGLAQVAFYAGNMKMARHLFEEVIKENPVYLDAYDWLASIHEHLGELEMAQRTLAQGAALSPNSFTRHKRLGEIAYQRGDLEAAEDAYRKTIKLGKHSVLKTPDIYFNLAMVCSAKDNHQEAILILQDVHNEFDDKVTRLHAKVVSGITYRKSGNHLLAAKLATEVAMLAKQNKNLLPEPVLMEATQLLFETGITNEAEDLAQTIVKNHHEDHELIDQVKEIFIRTGRTEAGHKIIESSRQEVIEVNNHGVGLAEQGKLDEAIGWLRNARKRLPNNKRIMMNLANIMATHIRKHGKNDGFMHEVRECINKVAKLDSQEEWCTRMYEILDALPGGKPTIPAEHSLI